MALTYEDAQQNKLHRFKRYPAYRDAGVEWLREIPAQWRSRESRNSRHWHWINVSLICVGKCVGFEEIDDGVWNVYYGPLKLGRLLERHQRIEDAYGRLKLLNV